MPEKHLWELFNVFFQVACYTPHSRNNAELNFKLTKTHDSIIKDIYLLNVDAKTKLELATNA